MKLCDRFLISIRRQLLNFRSRNDKAILLLVLEMGI